MSDRLLTTNIDLVQVITRDVTFKFETYSVTIDYNASKKRSARWKPLPAE